MSPHLFPLRTKSPPDRQTLGRPERQIENLSLLKLHGVLGSLVRRNSLRNMISRSDLFSNQTALFSPVLSIEWKQVWIRHGGEVASESRVRQGHPIHFFFGLYGVKDPLAKR